jgi:uncharacterized cupredoxin-like copper-binding protein
MRKVMTLIFALVLVLAACGDDDASSAADTTAADTTATTAAEEMHEEGDDEHSEEMSEESHEEMTEEEMHEEGDGHSEEAESHEGMDEAMAAMFVSDEVFPEATGAATSEYTIHLTEFGFDPGTLDLTPGETVRFILVNDGVLGHEFRLTTEHKAEEHIASGHEDHGGEGEGHHEDVDIIVNVAPGETRTVEMTLPADAAAIDYVTCLIPGHHEGGMHGTVEF